MSKDGQNENHSDFEQIYLEAILTHDVLKESDLIILLKTFGLGSFEEYSGDSVALKDMCYVLLNKVQTNKLFNEVRSIIDDEYKDRLSYDDSRNIFESLQQLDVEILRKFYEDKFKKEKLKKSVDENDIITLILGELCKLSHDEALKLISSLTR